MTSPGLSWDAMFKMTCLKLDLISDADMDQCIEKRMRGGVTYMMKGIVKLIIIISNLMKTLSYLCISYKIDWISNNSISSNRSI